MENIPFCSLNILKLESAYKHYYHMSKLTMYIQWVTHCDNDINSYGLWYLRWTKYFFIIVFYFLFLSSWREMSGNHITFKSILSYLIQQTKHCTIHVLMQRRKSMYTFLHLALPYNITWNILFAIQKGIHNNQVKFVFFWIEYEKRFKYFSWMA